MMTTEEIRQETEKRLAYVLNEINHGKALVNDAFLGKFWEGKIVALEKYQQYLEFILNNLR